MESLPPSGEQHPQQILNLAIIVGLRSLFRPLLLPTLSSRYTLCDQVYPTGQSSQSHSFHQPIVATCPRSHDPTGSVQTALPLVCTSSPMSYSEGHKWLALWVTCASNVARINVENNLT